MDISSPAANSTVTTPVQFVASADGASAWRVAAEDGATLFASAGTLDAWVLLPPGQQTIVVTALDSDRNPLASEALPIDVAGVAYTRVNAAYLPRFPFHPGARPIALSRAHANPRAPRLFVPQRRAAFHQG